MQVNAENVYAGSITAGEIHVRAFRNEMPDAGSRVEFAGHSWLVTRRNVLTPGGRACYVALREMPATCPNCGAQA